jgi:release factor glutamine methyltransferase
MSSPRALLAQGAATLGAAGVESPENDAEVLLAHVLGIPRGTLALAGEVSGEDAEAYALLVDRRAERTPLQHLTGSAGFRYADLAVGPGVFTL